MINLFTPFYKDKSEARQHELEECIIRNIQNPFIDSITLVLDEIFEHSLFDNIKVKRIKIGHRPTYSELFSIANKISRYGDISIVSNTDIYFDDTLLLIEDAITENMCITLSRWDVSANRTASLHDSIASQDVWIFKDKIRNINSNFIIGAKGADNRMAYEINEAGYEIKNYAKDIRCYHLHLSGIRNPSDKIPPPYLPVIITSLFENKKPKKSVPNITLDDVVFITSISPYHSNYQEQVNAVNGWLKFYDVISLNTKEEITKLKKDFPDVDFIPTDRTLKDITGKDIVCIHEMILYARKHNRDAFIINSDIFITEFPAEIIDGITVIRRNDYVVDLKNSIPFADGFDGFIIPNKYLTIFPYSMYAMGACWWDYWIPYTAIKKGVPINIIKENIAIHKKHGIQYNINEWDYFGKYFQWENKLFRFDSIGKMCQWVYKEINKNFI